jgi:hypothetical protein
MVDIDKWINFNWVSADMNGRRFEKTAMTVDVDLSLTGTKEIMQFDLGLGATIFYYSMLSDFISKETIKLESGKAVINGQKTAFILDQINIKMGNEIFSKNGFGLLYDHPLDSNDVIYHEDLPIGSIGVDFCEDKVLIIDYPNCRFSIFDSLPGNYAHVNFTSFRRNGHFIILPFEIQNKIEHFIFDTGSSLFSMAVDKDIWVKIPKKGKPREFNISAWNSIYTAIENAADIDIKFDGASLNKYPIYYCSHLDKDRSYYRSIGVSGIVGNTYFLEKTVIIDFKELKIGTVENMPITSQPL